MSSENKVNYNEEESVDMFAIGGEMMPDDNYPSGLDEVPDFFDDDMMTVKLEEEDYEELDEESILDMMDEDFVSEEEVAAECGCYISDDGHWEPIEDDDEYGVPMEYYSPDDSDDVKSAGNDHIDALDDIMQAIANSLANSDKQDNSVLQIITDAIENHGEESRALDDSEMPY